MPPRTVIEGDEAYAEHVLARVDLAPTSSIEVLEARISAYRERLEVLFGDIEDTTDIRYLVLVPHDGRDVPEDLAELADVALDEVAEMADQERDRGTRNAAEAVLEQVPGGCVASVQLSRLWDANRSGRAGDNWISFLPQERWHQGQTLVPEDLDEAVRDALLERYYWPTHRALAVLGASLPNLEFILELHSMDDQRAEIRPAAMVFHVDQAGRTVTPRPVVDRACTLLSEAFGEPVVIDDPYEHAPWSQNFQLEYNLRFRAKQAPSAEYLCLEISKRLYGRPFPHAREQGVLTAEACPKAFSAIVSAVRSA